MADTEVHAVIATSVGLSLPLRKSTHEIAAAVVADLEANGYTIVKSEYRSPHQRLVEDGQP